MHLITVGTMALGTIIYHHMMDNKEKGLPYFIGLAGSLTGGYIVGGIVERMSEQHE